MSLSDCCSSASYRSQKELVWEAHKANSTCLLHCSYPAHHISLEAPSKQICRDCCTYIHWAGQLQLQL